MNTFFEKEKTKRFVCIISYLFYFALTSIVYLFFDIPTLTLIVNWLIIFLITLNYESSMQNRVFVSVNIIFFMSVTEMIVGVCSGYFRFSFFEKGNYHDVMGLMISKISAYMIAIMFQKFKTLKKNEQVSPFEWVASLSIPVTTMILEVMIIQSETITQVGILFSLALGFLLDLTAFYMYDSLALSYSEKARLSVLEKENELYSKQCKLMQKSTEDLQSFRHDLSNQFAVVLELMERKKYDLAQSQIATFTTQLNYSMIYSTTGNTVIDGLINYKLQCAVNDHIKVISDIVLPYDLYINTIDIVTILGNLLDNAISALQEIPESDRKLTLKIVYSKDRLIIHMSNPYKGEIQYQNGEIITSKQDNANHGFGLKNVEKTVDKYDGYLEINTISGIFNVDILLHISGNIYHNLR